MMHTQHCFSCDDVFEILTRAPFNVSEHPAQQDDNDSQTAVLQHLQGCEECRQLANALRPATDCLHESLSAEEREGLPEFRSVLPLNTAQLVPSPQSASPSWRRQVLTIVAAGLLVVSGIAAWVGDGTSSHPPLAMASSVRYLTSLDLPANCGGETLNSAESLVGKLAEACCSDCHQSHAGLEMNPHTTGKIAQACTTCHHVTPHKVPAVAEKNCLVCHVDFM